VSTFEYYIATMYWFIFSKNVVFREYNFLIAFMLCKFLADVMKKKNSLMLLDLKTTSIGAMVRSDDKSLFF